MQKPQVQLTFKISDILCPIQFTNKSFYISTFLHVDFLFSSTTTFSLWNSYLKTEFFSFLVLSLSKHFSRQATIIISQSTNNTVERLVINFFWSF